MFDLKALAKDANKTQTEIGDIIGVDQSQVSFMMRGRRAVLPEHIKLLAESLPHMNMAKYYTPDIPAAIMTPAAEDSSEDVDYIKKEQQQEADSAVVIVQPPFVPNSVARKPEVNVLEWARKRRAEHAHNAFNMAKIFRDTDFVINMDNTAMSPAIRQNEYLFLSSFDEGTKIIDGKAYGIETVAWGILIRRLYDNGDSIIAKPENTLKFGSITIPKDEVVNIYHIKFRGATTLPPDTTDEAERLKQLRQQGEQISSLIDELGKAGSRQDRLISMLEKKQ